MNTQRILISGSTGFVGSALVSSLKKKGHHVVRLSRKKGGEDSIYWDPKSAEMALKDFEGFDAVIHLAGKNISSGRWTQKHKDQVFLSRVRDTWLLSQILLRLKKPPKIFICASATGFYGNRGDEHLSEKSGPGEGFLAEVCQKWEEASRGVKARGVRVVNTRFGLILSPQGGVLAKLLPLFRLGLGAILGTGRQYVSWIALEDIVGAIEHVLTHNNLEGAVNLVSPNPVTNEEFSKELAKSVGRPLFLRIPGGILRLFFAEMAEEMFLTSVRAYPEKLEGSGYQFRFPTLQAL